MQESEPERGNEGKREELKPMREVFKEVEEGHVGSRRAKDFGKPGAEWSRKNQKENRMDDKHVVRM